MIKGKDIYEIVDEVLKGKGAYHHTTLYDLWSYNLDTQYQPENIHPLICSCDTLECGNITVKITENEESIIWNNFYQGDAMLNNYDDNDDNYDKEENFRIEYLNLSFEFEKKDYKQKMEELKKISQALNL